MVKVVAAAHFAFNGKRAAVSLDDRSGNG